MEQDCNEGVSVVIPFFQAYDYFEEALNSVRTQTRKVDELIVVNDGCGQKADEYLSQFSDIQLVSSTANGGAAAARNLGVRRAKFKWVAFLDADDRWKENKIEKQLDYLKKNQAMDACHTGVETFDASGVVATYTNKPSDLSLNDLIESSHVTPPSLMINREKLLSIGLFDTRMRCSEDYDMSFRFLLAGYSIGFIPDALIEVRRMNHGNLSSSGKNHLIGHYQLFKKHKNVFKSQPGASISYIRRSFLTAGGKSSGVEQKIYFLVAKILAIFS